MDDHNRACFAAQREVAKPVHGDYAPDDVPARPQHDRPAIAGSPDRVRNGGRLVRSGLACGNRSERQESATEGGHSRASADDQDRAQ